MALKGFYLISDFHADMNKLSDPSWVDGEVLLSSNPKKIERVVKRIYNWVGVLPGRIGIFAGDTGNSAEITMRVLEEAEKKFEHILFCPGNHEYYFPRHRPMSDADRIMREFAQNRDSITLMEPGVRYVRDGVLFLGCTGWYNWDAIPELDMRQERMMWEQGSNDSRMPVYDIGYPDKLAFEHKLWLVDAVTEAQTDDSIQRIVIFTHTVPRTEFLVPAGHPWYRLNGSYCNSWMTDVVYVDEKKKIRTWAYGHTHHHNDAVVDGIRYVCNARGYDKEGAFNKVWKPKWIEL